MRGHSGQSPVRYAHNNLGIALHDQGEPEAAIAQYREAIRIEPDHALAHFNLGGALHDQGKLTEAVAEFRFAIRVEPNDAGGVTTLASS